MSEYLYAKNYYGYGYTRYEIIRETKTMYVIKVGLSEKKVPKKTMSVKSDKWTLTQYHKENKEILMQYNNSLLCYEFDDVIGKITQLRSLINIEHKREILNFLKKYIKQE